MPPTITATQSPARRIEVQWGDTEISIHKPSAWFAYPENAHLILSEFRDPTLANRLLEGIVVNIWTEEIAPDVIHAPVDDMLAHILRDATLRRTSSTTTPRSFKWGGIDVAYYLLNSGDGNVTFVMVLDIQNEARNDVIGINISAPHTDLQRMRRMIPIILDGFTVNEITLAGEDLHTNLEDIFMMPVYDPNPETAIEVTPGWITPPSSNNN